MNIDDVIQGVFYVIDIRTGKPVFVRQGKRWVSRSVTRLLQSVLGGTMVVIFCLLFGACQQEGIFATPDGGVGGHGGPIRGAGLLSDASSSVSDVQTWPVDKSVDIQPVSDLSVGDFLRDVVDKGGDEVQPADLSPPKPDLLVLDTLSDLSPTKPDLFVLPGPDTLPDLMSKNDAELLGPGQTCTASSQCQQGHCSALTGRCCQTACLDTGCGLGCGPDGLCISCQFCVCTVGQCHC